MFEHQGLLENRDSSRRIDQPPLFLGSFTSLVESLRCSYRRQAFVYQPDRYVAPGRQPCSPLPRLCRGRTLPPLKLRGRPTSTSIGSCSATTAINSPISSAPARTVVSGYASTPPESHAATPIRASPQSIASRTPRRKLWLIVRRRPGVNATECRENVRARAFLLRDTLCNCVGCKERTCTCVPSRSRALAGDQAGARPSKHAAVQVRATPERRRGAQRRAGENAKMPEPAGRNPSIEARRS